MPRAGQIIPNYLVPHVQTYINDNSTFTDAVATPADNGVRLLCVFASPKGEDGVIKAVTNVVDYLEEYGNPNYALYGQAGYMPYIALSGGNAKCYCMRVMPDDAMYSNVVVSAYAKTDVDAQGNSTFNVLFKATPISNLNDKDALPINMENMSVLPPETNDEGYSVYPLFAVCAKGKGVYGDSLRVRVVADTIMNAENEYMNYIFEVLDGSTNTLLKKETHRGCFDANAISNGASLLFDDVLIDPDKGSKRIEIATFSAGFEGLYNAYKAVAGAAASPIGECDLLTGMTKDNSAMVGYSIDGASIALNSTIGVAMAGGYDGAFDINYQPVDIGGGFTGPTREQILDEMYIRAFSGELDPSITSKRRVPCELILDANYSETVKMKLVELALKRYDARCIIDAGILNTITQASTWVQKTSIKAIDDFILSKECWHYKIRDPFSGKIIPMTATYFIAENLPTHYRTFGNQVPFVSEDYAQLTGHIRNSVRPAIDADDLETKELLYTNRCNFIECIAEDTYVRGVQGTSQSTWSDLSEENNVAVLLEMKRMLEEFVSARLYNFAEAEDRLRFTEDADRMFSAFRNTKVRNFNVYFDMNAFEEERSILHCYLSVVFKTMAKRGIIEIDINKRV